MKKNELYKMDDRIIRVLDIKDGKALIIDCVNFTMPVWETEEHIGNVIGPEMDMPLDGIKTAFKEAQGQKTDNESSDSLRRVKIYSDGIQGVNPETSDREIMYHRYTMIAGILPFIGDEKMRSVMITRMAEEYGVSKQTIRLYLCRYLASQDIHSLLPKVVSHDRELTQDEKNIRWSLNRYFYNTRKNSLKTAYKFMLRDKYCDENGVLKENYPTFNQFRYFYRKTKKMQNYLISRNGLSNYQRNDRPCLGDGVQEYAPAPGTGMMDATVCDIYLINESSQVVGRPILTACVDAYSGLCLGYSLSWEGGIYSLRNLMLSIIADKVEYCKKFGIKTSAEDWGKCGTYVPGKLVTDQGSEYVGNTFEQLTELGITLVNLPPYRPELKGVVENFFEVVQNEFKPYLKGKGVIEPDFQERGAHDYRKDACLTLENFEKVIIHCIIHYNTRRVVEGFPFTDDMLKKAIRPYANNIFHYGLSLPGANFVRVSEDELVLCLLPRTYGRFNRFGLNVNKLRYRCDGYTEEYLSGSEAVVAFNPDDVSFVWLKERSGYVRFELIESIYSGKELAAVQVMQESKKQIIRAEGHDSLQADLELAGYIQTIASNAVLRSNRKATVDLKNIRNTRTKERRNTHIEHIREVGLDAGRK